LIAVSSLVGATLTAPAHAEAVLQPCVILLHGLARSSSSMKKLDKALSKSGYLVRNTDYPSTQKSVDDLAPEVITTASKAAMKKATVLFTLLPIPRAGY